MPSDTGLPADSGKGGGRLPPLPPEQMTEEQKRVAAGIAGGPRGGIRGPFNAMLRSPVVAERFQLLGEYLRFNSSIPPDLNEMAILITAREWSAQYEWYAHHILAMKAGLPPAIAAAIAEGRKPDGMTEDQRIIWEFCTELYRTRTVSDATYEQTKARFGENGIIDLIAVSGYYVAVGMTLNVAQVPLPPGVAEPLKPLG
ncbi:carboxymuconolactone decarboxylase family protein [Siccirubricoccus sp. KC 17139]|uniref:Carboxymuconolactone decarboxylase family protein n=1 Tax=Siccirubricoccus soli TaxID=2899147 RepID=A0ABT1D4S5_9PROT|nr:carboxymuconolactone decarboxylase family protein [Siccirubricoccus soli]MCO6416933.1 carboxymuconolactone decarboxylase family protein [Siccirubricoccus soli]MCP2683068.1 carboxymuconolactone decarboxylase family protein [Siccirubricoccus soli]